jgi:hypothetical protein
MCVFFYIDNPSMVFVFYSLMTLSIDRFFLSFFPYHKNVSDAHWPITYGKAIIISHPRVVLSWLFPINYFRQYESREKKNVKMYILMINIRCVFVCSNEVWLICQGGSCIQATVQIWPRKETNCSNNNQKNNIEYWWAAGVKNKCGQGGERKKKKKSMQPY